jgi:hypothetical protein
MITFVNVNDNGNVNTQLLTDGKLFMTVYNSYVCNDGGEWAIVQIDNCANTIATIHNSNGNFIEQIKQFNLL